MATRKPLRGLRHHARASLPDLMLSAGVAELVDALDLGSSDESCGGSSPSARTILLRAPGASQDAMLRDGEAGCPPKPGVEAPGVGG